MKKIIILVLTIVSVMAFTGCAKESYLEDSNTSSQSVSESDTEESSGSSEIYVQIDGAVKTPGVYRLSSDARVFALIEKAGGFSSEAYTADINQAQALSDGQKITVPTKNEHKAEESSASAGASAVDDRVDINKADITELTTISGIGDVRAQAIITYREQNGSFRDVKDITKVSGIGDSTYNRIKDRIKV